MPEYEVTWEGRVREVYHVEAASPEEAREKWSDEEPTISEVWDGEVISVEEATDD